MILASPAAGEPREPRKIIRPWALEGELLSAEGVRKAEQGCVERLAGSAPSLSPIYALTEERVSELREVDPELVGPSAVKLELERALGRTAADKPELTQRRLAAWRSRRSLRPLTSRLTPLALVPLTVRRPAS